MTTSPHSLSLRRLLSFLSSLAVSSGFSLSSAEPSPALSKPLEIAMVQRATPVDFEKEILPMLRGSCLACHNRTKAKAELILETPADILKGGESGPSVVPRKPDESLLLKLAAHQDKPHMPPKDNKVEALNLTADQLGLLKLWIAQGATGEVHATPPVEWQSLATNVNPIFAVALTRDGQTAACGRANRLMVYDLPSEQQVATLIDPELSKTGLYDQAGAAHRDMVNALAFSPDGMWLASGDYRAVKLWKRNVEVTRHDLAKPDLKRASTLAASPDGRWVVAGYEDGRVALWNGETGEFQNQWSAHDHGIVQLAFSPDGSRVASISGSQRVGVWSVSEGKSVFWISTPAGTTSITWAGNGRQIISAGDDKTIRVWQIPGEGQTNASLAKELRGHESAITSLVAHSASRLLSGGSDGIVRLWDLEKGETTRRLEHGGYVTALALRQDGKRAASAGSNAVVKVWNLEDGKMLFELSGDVSKDQAVGALERDLVFTKGEISFRQGALDEAKKREKIEADFAAKSLENRVTAERTLTEKQKAVLVALEARAAAERSPSELAAETQKTREAIEAAEAPARQSEAEVAAAQKRVDQTKANAEAAARSSKEIQQAIEKDTAKTAVLADAKKIADSVLAMAGAQVEDAKLFADRFSKEAAAKRKAAAATQAELQKKLTEIAEREKQVPEKLAAGIKALEEAEKAAETALAGKRSSEDQLAANQRAAKRAADAVPLALAALTSVQNAQKQIETDLEAAKVAAGRARQPVLALGFSPDGRVLTAGGADQHLHTWGAESGMPIQSVDGHLGSIHALVAASGRSWVAVGTNGVPVLSRQSERWALANVIGSDVEKSPLLGRVNTLQFSPDGKWLATGSGEPSRSGQLLLWNLATRECVRNFTNAHSDVVLGVSFSSDGKQLASSASDRFVKVWDPETGKMTRSFEGHTHHVLGVSWKRDARTLASAGGDKVIKLWNVVTGEQKRTLGGGEKEVTSVAYIDGTGEALVTSGDAQVRLMNEEGKTVRSFGGASDFVQSAAITPDGRWVIGGGQDSVLRFWDGAKGQLVRAFQP